MFQIILIQLIFIPFIHARNIQSKNCFVCNFENGVNLFDFDLSKLDFLKSRFTRQVYDEWQSHLYKNTDRPVFLTGTEGIKVSRGKPPYIYSYGVSKSKITMVNGGIFQVNLYKKTKDASRSDVSYITIILLEPTTRRFGNWTIWVDTQKEGWSQPYIRTHITAEMISHIHLFGHEGETTFFFIDAIRYYSKSSLNSNCTFYDTTDSIPRPVSPQQPKSVLDKIEDISSGSKSAESYSGDFSSYEGNDSLGSESASSFEKEWINRAVKFKHIGLSKELLEHNLEFLKQHKLAEAGENIALAAPVVYGKQEKRNTVLDRIIIFLTFRRTVGLLLMYTLFCMLACAIGYRAAYSKAIMSSGRCCKCNKSLSLKNKRNYRMCTCELEKKKARISMCSVGREPPPCKVQQSQKIQMPRVYSAVVMKSTDSFKVSTHDTKSDYSWSSNSDVG